MEPKIKLCCGKRLEAVSALLVRIQSAEVAAVNSGNSHESITTGDVEAVHQGF